MSTEIAISKINDDYTNIIEKTFIIFFVYLHVSKAFDRVTYQISKNTTKIRGLLLKILEIFFSNRMQYTKINNCFFLYLPLISSVSQRSVFKTINFFNRYK